MPQPDKDGEYEIEKILGHRRRKDGKSRYLVKWKGYSYEESTWEPSTNFKKQTLEKYHRERKESRANESDSSSDDEALATLIGGGLQTRSTEPGKETKASKKRKQSMAFAIKQSDPLTCGDCGHQWTCKLQPPKNPIPTQCRRCEAQAGTKFSTGTAVCSHMHGTAVCADQEKEGQKGQPDVEMLNFGEHGHNGAAAALASAFTAVFQAGRSSQ